ncbi:MAG: TadE/TadG family type IV pilus assembly protein [Planctomycetota bacterium]|jgi:Flp pilus assembly protein TadG
MLAATIFFPARLPFLNDHRPTTPQKPAPIRRRGPGRRRGATLVEFALVAPLLFLLIFAIIEFGRFVMAQQILTNAAREGARRAVLEQSTVSEVQQTVSDYLANSTIPGASVTVSPDPLTLAGFGDSVTVTCSVSYDQITWMPAPWILGGTNLSAESTMCAERPD